MRGMACMTTVEAGALGSHHPISSVPLTQQRSLAPKVLSMSCVGREAQGLCCAEAVCCWVCSGGAHRDGGLTTAAAAGATAA